MNTEVFEYADAKINIWGMQFQPDANIRKYKKMWESLYTLSSIRCIIMPENIKLYTNTWYYEWGSLECFIGCMLLKSDHAVTPNLNMSCTPWNNIFSMNDLWSKIYLCLCADAVESYKYVFRGDMKSQNMISAMMHLWRFHI